MTERDTDRRGLGKKQKSHQKPDIASVLWWDNEFHRPKLSVQATSRSIVTEKQGPSLTSTMRQMTASAILGLDRLQIIKDKVDPFAMDLISEAEVDNRFNLGTRHHFCGSKSLAVEFVQAICQHLRLLKSFTALLPAWGYLLFPIISSCNGSSHGSYGICVSTQRDTVDDDPL